MMTRHKCGFRRRGETKVGFEGFEGCKPKRDQHVVKTEDTQGSSRLLRIDRLLESAFRLPPSFSWRTSPDKWAKP